jgi:hypothetical protein
VNERILSPEPATIVIFGASGGLRRGEHDSRLQPTLHEYPEWLQGLDIEHELIIVEGAGHDYRDILEGYGQNTFAFWTSAFGDSQ